jgi:hypothetical protein
MSRGPASASQLGRTYLGCVEEIDNYSDNDNPEEFLDGRWSGYRVRGSENVNLFA